MPQFEQLDLAGQDGNQLLQALANIGAREQILRFLDGNLQVGCDQVGQPSRLAHLHRDSLQLIGQIWNQRDKFRKLADEMRLERVDFFIWRQFIGEPSHVRLEVRLALREVEQFEARKTLDQDAHTLVRIAQHLEDAHRGGALIHALRTRIFLFRIFLRGQRDDAIALADAVYQF